MVKFKILGLNQDIVWKNYEANFKLIEEHFENTHADLYLLPEMFSTGFCMEAAEIADKDDVVLNWMKNFSSKKNAAVAGSVSVAEDGQFFNRFYFVEPQGKVQYYDKRHLFSFSGEDKIYTAGSDRVVVDYKGIRFLLQVCYDLRFPVFSRNNDDYDAILYVANWPQKRVEAWRHLLKARAIENLAYVFGLNRIGTDGNGLFYEETSGFYFADGTEEATRRGNLIEGIVNIERLKKFRNHFGFLNDRDNYKILD